MSPPPGSFIWYELMTTDATSASKFYGAVVGWKIAAQREAPADQNDYRMIVRDDGDFNGGVLQLTPRMCAEGARPMWLGYLHVRGIDAAIAAIVADGGNVLMPRLDIPQGSIAMVQDPMGTPFYVMDPVPPPDKPHARSDVFDPTAVQRVRWNELASPHLARAKAFYAKHFDFQFNEVMPMGELGDYCFIHHAGVRLGAIMQQPPQSPAAAWLFYFGVQSIAAAQRAIEGGGGGLLYGPQEVPGGDWILIATDPQGAAFGVVGPRGN